MKLRLPKRLYRAVLSAIAVLSSTIASSSLYAASTDVTLAALDNELNISALGVVTPDLTVDGIAAIYINNKDGLTSSGDTVVEKKNNFFSTTYTLKTPGSFNGSDTRWATSTSGSSSASYWRGDKVTSERKKDTYTGGIKTKLNTILLGEGNALYLGGTYGYNGTVYVEGTTTSLTDYATIAAYSPSTTSVSLNKLTGSADVLFLGVATSGTTNFTVTDATGYSGTVYMSADTGAVQLNVEGGSWANTVFDFKKDAALSKSAIQTNVKAPSKQTLNLTADTSIKALTGGSATAYVNVNGAYQLTMGNNATQDYTYDGNLGRTISLVKEGNYKQSFSRDTNITSAKVNAGILEFETTLTVEEVAISGGAALHTGAGSDMGHVSMAQGATWVVDNNTTVDDISIIYDISNTGGTATLQGAGENVVLMAPTTINLYDYNGYGTGDVLNSPFFTLDNLTLDIDHTILLNGYTNDFDKGDVINFAQLTNGSGYQGSGTIAVSHGTHVHSVTVQITQDNILQFIIGGLKPDLLVNGIAALYMDADGTASGNTKVDRRNNTYSVSNRGSYDSASTAWNWSATNGVGYWLHEYNGNYQWTGTDTGGITDTIKTIQLIEGNALYLGGSAYGGTLLVEHSSSTHDVATIASYDPSTTAVTINRLEGHADVLFLGTATTGTTTFTVQDASEYEGTVYMTANGSAVQLNIAGDWADALFHFGREEGMSNSAIDATGALPTAQILNLTGNAVVKGLADGSPYALVTGAHTLTLGHNGEDYEFFGVLGEEINSQHYGELSLTKVGNNTQYINRHADLKDITVQAGTLHFGDILHAVNATVEGGAMQMTSGSFTGAVNVSGGVLQATGTLHADSLSHSAGVLDVAAGIVVAHRMELSGTVQDTFTGTLDTSELFLKDSAQLSILNNAVVHDNLELNGGSLSITGALQVENIFYRSGALSTGDGTQVQHAVLSAGTDWHLGENTSIVDMTLTGIVEGKTATLSGGSFTLSGTILQEGANTANAWLTLNDTDMYLQNSSVIRGVDITDETGTMTFAYLSNQGSLTSFGGVIDVYSKSGGKYDGFVRTEGNVVYIDLTATWDDLIWSGVANGTIVRDEAHHNGQLVMGHVWRADGSAQDTGWHEQNVGGGDGVYVNDRDVIFGDTDYHGKAVGAAGRDVLIVGNVAPGNIYVTADTESGQISGGSEARMMYGYAFYAAAGDVTSGIADYVDAQGDITPTRIIKDGKAMLVLNTANTFSGGIDVNAGGLYLATPGAAGTGAIRVHTDNTWTLNVWQYNEKEKDWRGNTVVKSGFEEFDRVGTELMVCYLHSDENASAFRSGTVANDIIMTDQDPTKAGQFAISFARAGFNTAGSENNHANTPRHWRCLTLSGALVGTGNKEDKLVLTGYSSTWGNYRDQSYVTSFALNERTKSDQSLVSNFNGTVILKNTINTSPLWSNRLEARTAGTVQVMLSDNKLQHALMDLTRESVVVDEFWEAEADEGVPRQSYNNILVLNGAVGLRGLTADFHGTGHVYTWDRKPTEWGSGATRKYQTLAQNEEVWHVRTVANAMATLTLGTHEDSDTAVYVYSGAMGFAQSYVEPTEAAVMWGDGFDTPPTGANDQFLNSFGSYSMGLELISLVKESASQQYIHTAKLLDVMVDEGVLGFNHLELGGNLTLTSGSNLKLGVTGQVGTQKWEKIAEGTQSSIVSMDGKAYALAPTTYTADILSGKDLTIYTKEPADLPYLPTAAVVDGNIRLNSGSGMLFEVDKVEPFFRDKSSVNTPEGLAVDFDGHDVSKHVLLDVNGSLDLMSNTADMEIRFRGVNFSLTPFSNRLYYLAETDNITVGGLDSSEFESRLISLGYGYFGLVDTLDSSNTAHHTDGKDYLVMSVMGDPRHTWSGASELTNGSYTWVAYDGESVPEFDYHWKENSAFVNGHVVIFGNLYNPENWEQNEQLTSEDTVRVLTQGTIDTVHPSDLEGHDVLLHGTVAEEFTINGINEKSAFGTDYQLVNIRGEVAPLSFIIGAEYVDVTGDTEKVCQDDTNYWFYSLVETPEPGEEPDAPGFIRDATASELSDMFKTNQFEGSEWFTNLEKYGEGTAVIATANTFSGGTKLYGGKIVMQDANALGSGTIYITDGARLQGDFADNLTNEQKVGAYAGEGMQTTTVHNVVEVRLNHDIDSVTDPTRVDARIVNAYDKKMVLTELIGDPGAVVTLYGTSAAVSGEHSVTLPGSERPAYTYAVFKVLDPSGFHGTIRMDGNIWGAARGSDGGKVQMEIMSTAKSDDGADWLNTDIDLSVNNGTERTVLALDAVEGANAPTHQETLINALMGTGEVRMADGAINSSVVNMSETQHITLVIEGLSNGDYDGVLGYGEFQRTTEYGTSHRDDIPRVGETCHHYGCGNIGDLSVLKKGAGTTQSVYNAWIHTLEVEGGTFAVDHALQVKEIISGGGRRVFVGTVSDLNTVYALTVGDGGVLSMDTQLFETGSTTKKYDSLGSLSAGTNNEDAVGDVGWVQLQNGATLTAHTDWYTDTQIEIQSGSAVTFNAHNYTPDPYITSDHNEHAHVDQDGDAHEHFDHFNSSHIIQLLGKLSGTSVALTFNNEQMSPGANDEERGQADYMGYVAINNHNEMTGTIEVKDKTVLQVLTSGTVSDMDVTIDGDQAAMQLVEAGKTQYVDSLTVRNGGALLLGGAEKTSLGSGEKAMANLDYANEKIQFSVTNRYGRQDGHLSAVYSDLSGAGASFGGTDAAATEAYAVHMMAHTNAEHTVHDTKMESSLMQLKNGASLKINDMVSIDRNSAICGNAGLELELKAVEMFSEISPAKAAETATTGASTKVELSVSGGTMCQVGDQKIYHVYADQFHNVNIGGKGLEITLTDNVLYNAGIRGADFVAVQISGIGQFLYEEQNVYNFPTDSFVLLDAAGNDISEYWVTSAVVADKADGNVSKYMLYFTAVPEPSTATLSLLALAALAARRRRR